MPLSTTNKELYCQIQFQCMKCKKFFSTMRIQLMAELEQDEERPFESTGILDLNGKTTKCKLLCTVCIYVFICLKYKQEYICAGFGLTFFNAMCRQDYQADFVRNGLIKKCSFCAERISQQLTTEFGFRRIVDFVFKFRFALVMVTKYRQDCSRQERILFTEWKLPQFQYCNGELNKRIVSDNLGGIVCTNNVPLRK